jgi:FixJ family two-component response regulator
VAVVEDDEVARAALGRVLLAGGFDAALFDSAETFIAAPPNPAPFCLIVDVHLTGMSGIELQDRLRSTGMAVPTIVTTGDRAVETRERAEQGGCAAFLWKPYSAESILALVAAIAQSA